MSSSFQNPRNPLAALWASAVESYLRGQYPDLSVQEIRQLPMMQGVYEHLSQLSKKQRVAKPQIQNAVGASGPLQIAQMAYLSQSFLDLAVATAGFNNPDVQLYLSYVSLINSYNQSHDIDDFSTADIVGFALCVIIWIGLAGLGSLNTTERNLIGYLIDALPITTSQKDQVHNFWNSINKSVYSPQYRDANQYNHYKAMPWKIPAGAQIVMLGDWGTALDDAHEFLYAIWKKAYLNSPGATIVFLHLGDIYYCGLPYECEHYFYDVFVSVGTRLATELNDTRFSANPPIFTIPGNHEYYSYGYGYYQLLDMLNQNVPGISHSDIYQQCSFFCLQTEDSKWQFLGMDTGQADGNGLLSALQSAEGWVKEHLEGYLPTWGWLETITGLATTTYEDWVGPFQPTLHTSEENWLKDRMDEFDGKTIMLSHHQLFSREAKINHKSPEYMNTWLDRSFNEYYTNKIAAWYWGHEHTFAVYLDGLMGLNKGRLLGSSSYEATLDGDTPYANNYPAVPFAAGMTDTLVHKNSEGLYYHVGAIMSQSANDMAVKYYQFPAWTQLDPRPSNLQLEEITTMAEHISTSFKSLKPSWIGNQVISQDKVTTDNSPSIAVWGDMLYLMYKDGSALKICTANAAGFQPGSTSAAPNWSSPASIKVNSTSISTTNSPAIIAVDGNLYGFYKDSSDYLQGIKVSANNSTPSAWSSIGAMSNQVGDAAPEVCFFQGRIYIVYRKNGSNSSLCWAYYDVAAGLWHDFGALQDSSGNQFKSDNTPALAADAFHIYMVYQQKDKTDIRWAVGSPSATAPSGTANNISWEDKGDIKTIAKGGQTNPDTNIGMTLAYANGVFILVYASTDSNKLTQCALNNTGKDNTGTWIGSNTVKVNTNKNSTSTVKSSRAPAMAVTSGGGFLVYRGDSHDEIYWAYY